MTPPLCKIFNIYDHSSFKETKTCYWCGSYIIIDELPTHLDLPKKPQITYEDFIKRAIPLTAIKAANNPSIKRNTTTKTSCVFNNKNLLIFILVVTILTITKIYEEILLSKNYNQPI